MKYKLRIWRILLIIVAILWSWLFIYAQKYSKPVETDYQKVDRLSEFYVTSGYVTGYDYENDIKALQRIKQKELDLLSYEETYKYIQTQTVDNQFIMKIDVVVKDAKALKSQEPVPAYLKMVTTTEKKQTDAMQKIDDFIQGATTPKTKVLNLQAVKKIVE